MAKIQVNDQYADGEAARAWARFIGDAGRRTKHYGAFLRRTFQGREEGDKKRVLDVACGTGVDSVLLLDTGAFHVTSCDASDQMLKHALRTRWARRREPAFDAWQIEEANWLTLLRDLADAGIEAPGAYDAVLCLGNSFAHMPASPTGSKDPQAQQRTALSNFWACVRPGGVLIVDHRNYDHILQSGATPSSCFYYNNSVTDIRTSGVYVDGQPVQVVMDYAVGTSDNGKVNGIANGKVNGKGSSDGDSSGCSSGNSSESEESEEEVEEGAVTHFRLTYYPHRLGDFCRLLREALGQEQFAAARHSVYADFHSSPLPQWHSPIAIDKEDPPAVYVHVLHKPL